MADALLKEAQQHVRDEEQDEALKKATEARAAFEKAKDAGKAREALHEMALALCLKDNRKEANKIVQEELTKCRAAKDSKGEAQMLLSSAWVNCDKRGTKNREIAWDHAEECREICNGLGDKKMEATCLLILTNITLKHKPDRELMEESAEEAMTYVGGALLLFRGIGDKRGEANALHWLAVAQNLLYRPEAFETILEAARLYKEVGDALYAAEELKQAAVWHAQDPVNGDRDEAVRVAEEALTLVREKKRATNLREMSTLSVLVRVHVARKDFGAAIKAAEKGKERFKDLGDKKAEADVRLMMMHAHFSNTADVSADAMTLADEAMATYKELGSMNSWAKVSSLASLIIFKKGDLAKARKYATDAIGQAQAEFTDKGVAKHVLVGCSLAEKNFDEALKQAKETVELCVEATAPVKEAITLLTVCNVHFQMSDFDKAMKCAREAQALFFEENQKALEAEAHQAQAEVHQAQQNHQPAIRAAEKAINTWRSVGDAKELAHTLVLAAQNQILLLAKKLESDGQDAPQSTEMKVGANKALNMSLEAQALAQNLEDQKTYASALCAGAQAMIWEGAEQYEKALDDVEKAQGIFKDLGETQRLANTLTLSARLRLAAGQRLQSVPDELAQALELFRQCNDAKGEELVLQLLDHINRFSVPGGMPADGAGYQPAAIAAAPTGGASAQVAAAPAQAEEVTEDQVLSVLQDVTKSILPGKGDIDVDKPLMEAGITSMTAILYRQNLVTALGGSVDLPLTLVFDYPSISSIADFVLDSGAKLSLNMDPSKMG